MKLQNRVGEIKILLTHVLQDFFYLDIASKGLKTSWKETFIHHARNNVKKFPSKYQGIINKFIKQGADSFDITDLDPTIISAIYNKGNQKPFDCHPDIITRMSILNNDRCSDAHTDGNETDSELLQWSFGTLHDINNFINIVLTRYSETINTSSILGEEFHAFARKHNKTITDLREAVAKDYEEAISELAIINHNLYTLMNSSQKTNCFLDIIQYYIKSHDKIRFFNFLVAAADNGFEDSYHWLADFYYGDMGPGIPTDYIKAAHYYELCGIDSLALEQKLNLANIYLNNIAGTYNKGQQLLEECSQSLAKTRNGKPRYKLESYKTPENYTFWREINI